MKTDEASDFQKRIGTRVRELRTDRRISAANILSGNFDPALVNLLGVLTGFEVDLAQFFFAAQTLSLDIDDVYGANDVTLRATPSVEAPTTARIEDAMTNALVKTLPMTEEGDAYVARASLPAGAYRVKVTADFPTNPVTVTETFLTVN